MDLNTYSDQVLPLAAETSPEICDRLQGSDTPYDNVQLLHGIIGVSKEIGELQDNYVRHVFYGKGESLDIPNVLEELGDIMWYLNLIRATAGFTWEQILTANVDKLAKKRYKSGSFSKEQALERDLDAERQMLEKTATTSTPLPSASVKTELQEKLEEVRKDVNRGIVFEHQEKNNAARQWRIEQDQLKADQKKNRTNPDVITQEQLNKILNSPQEYQAHQQNRSAAIVTNQLVGGSPQTGIPLVVKDALARLKSSEIGNLAHALAGLSPEQIEKLISNSNPNGTDQPTTTD